MRQFERIYLARMMEERRPVLDIDGMPASGGIRAWHWWSLAGLETTGRRLPGWASRRPPRPYFVIPAL
jgi:hypothetical protein